MNDFGDIRSRFICYVEGGAEMWKDMEDMEDMLNAAQADGITIRTCFEPTKVCVGVTTEIKFPE